MSFEDELRETMRAHDADAPSAADLPPLPSRARRRMLLPVVAAAVVLLVAGGAFAITQVQSDSHHTTAIGPTTAPASAGACPAKYQDDHNKPWVPADPIGIDAATRLVPDEVPSSAFICAYLDGHVTLSGTRDITQNLDGLRDMLSWEPRDTGAERLCTLDIQRQDGDNYLIRVVYPSGAIWVSAPGYHCDGSSNGAFTSIANLRDAVMASYATGAWASAVTPIRRAPGCGVLSQGRLGQETAMVPGTPNQLAVCMQQSSVTRRSTTVSSDAIRGVARRLNELPNFRTTYSCTPGPTGHVDALYYLEFRYARGPSVVVDLTPGCRPEVENFSLEADSASSVLPLVEQLLNG
jgi:hypothetical protein